jgi:hypothetical protein
MESEHLVPIWFFIGGTILVYGVFIVGAGLLGQSSRGGKHQAELPACGYLVGRADGNRRRVLLLSL